LSFAFLIPASIEPNYFYVFVGGFFGISAMFLPGISGAFILLILGLYEFMIHVLEDILHNLSYFVVFALGAVLGALVISRLISYLFKKDRCKTLYVLLGLVIGCLSIPVKRVYTIDFQIPELAFGISFLLLGMFLVMLIRAFRNDVFLEE